MEQWNRMKDNNEIDDGNEVRKWRKYEKEQKEKNGYRRMEQMKVTVCLKCVNIIIKL